MDKPRVLKDDLTARFSAPFLVSNINVKLLSNKNPRMGLALASFLEKRYFDGQSDQFTLMLLGLGQDMNENFSKDTLQQ
ncbi:hypothetical protein Tco_1002567 [Tanacetum coccineum]|uniref:Uncharacterized protein n=1 Tax=Tanacetum coccineum TaxID=301880 RepID=A0ABQ5F7I1_9ASTR